MTSLCTNTEDFLITLIIIDDGNPQQQQPETDAKMKINFYSLKNINKFVTGNIVTLRRWISFFLNTHVIIDAWMAAKNINNTSVQTTYHIHIMMMICHSFIYYSNHNQNNNKSSTHFLIIIICCYHHHQFHFLAWNMIIDFMDIINQCFFSICNKEKINLSSNVCLQAKNQQQNRFSFFSCCWDIEENTTTRKHTVIEIRPPK